MTLRTLPDLIIEDGVILFDRDGFFGSVLDSVRARLARLGSRQERLGHIRYWVLSPGAAPGETVTL
jgi:hypothetical protein